MSTTSNQSIAAALAQYRTQQQSTPPPAGAVAAPTAPVVAPVDPTTPNADTGITDALAQYRTNKAIPTPAPDTTDKPVGGFLGNLFTGATQAFGKTAGQALAAPKNADLYADALKQYNDVQNNLVQAIQKKRAAGGDITRLQAALDEHTATAPKLTDFTGDVVNKTTGEVLGEAAGTALEALSGGALGEGAETAASKTLTTGQKVAKGAKIGALYGGIGGAANSAAEGGDVGNVVGGGLAGAAIGAGTGGALEGIASKLPKPKVLQTDAEKAAAKFSTDLKNAEESIYPTLSKNEKATVKLKDEKGLFGTRSVPDLQNNPTTKPIIESVANLPDDIKVKPSDSVAVKESKLQQGITRLHQATESNLAAPEVKAATKFDPAQYDSFMKKNILDPVEQEFGRDSKEFATAEKGVQTSKQALSENNAYGVHNGRQAFDKDFKANNKQAFKMAKSLFGQLDPHVNNVIETGRNIRTAMNDFAESLLPKDHPFRANLREESNLIKGLNEMRSRSTGQLDKNAVTRKLDRNPVAKKGVKTLAGIFKMGAGVDLVNHL